MVKDSDVICGHTYSIDEHASMQMIRAYTAAAAVISQIDAILRTSLGLKYGNGLAVVQVELTAAVA